MIVLEAGINHFGSLKEANYILNYFLKSKFNSITFMAQSKDFYRKFKNKIEFKLPLFFYQNALKKAHKLNKKIGFAVCDLETANELNSIKFDFYKLLGLGINKPNLINFLKRKNKKIYISTSIANISKIKKCIKNFGSKKNLNILHTSMSYSINDLNLKRIKFLKNFFNIPVGYGHHFNETLPIFLSLSYNPDFIFIYVKTKKKSKRIYPDDKHAIYIKDLENFYKKFSKVDHMLGHEKKHNTKIKISFKGIHI